MKGERTHVRCTRAPAAAPLVRHARTARHAPHAHAPRAHPPARPPAACCCLQAAAAAAAGRLGRYGASVQSTQLHGPRVVLVGDAAHAMTGELRQVGGWLRGRAAPVGARWVVRGLGVVVVVGAAGHAVRWVGLAARASRREGAGGERMPPPHTTPACAQQHPQGLSCGIEGVRALNLVLRVSGDSLDKAPTAFSQVRQDPSLCEAQPIITTITTTTMI